jgi:hypothetical protein
VAAAARVVERKSRLLILANLLLDGCPVSAYCRRKVKALNVRIVDL